MKEDFLYRQGDIVKVWSLQSFFYGGFIKGDLGIVYQDQHDVSGSVLVTLIRNINGVDAVDFSYEIYRQQVKRVAALTSAFKDRYEKFKEHYNDYEKKTREHEGEYSVDAIPEFMGILEGSLKTVGYDGPIYPSRNRKTRQGDSDAFDTEKDHFGDLLKRARLNYAGGGQGMGMRNFAIELGIKPSQLSRIERGLEEAPKSDKWLELLFDLLTGMSDDEEDALIEAYNAPFIMQYMPEYPLPVFVCTTDGKPLCKEKLMSLAHYLHDIAHEHNLKADKHNAGVTSE